MQGKFGFLLRLSPLAYSSYLFVYKCMYLFIVPKWNHLVEDMWLEFQLVSG